MLPYVLLIQNTRTKSSKNNPPTVVGKLSFSLATGVVSMNDRCHFFDQDHEISWSQDIDVSNNAESVITEGCRRSDLQRRQQIRDALPEGRASAA